MNNIRHVDIHHPQSGRVVGYVEGNVFYQKRKSTALLKKPPAISFAAQHLKQFVSLNIKWLHVQVSQKTYITTMDWFREYSVRHMRASEIQYYLVLGWWSIDGRPPKNKPPKTKPELLQGNLFGK